MGETVVPHAFRDGGIPAHGEQAGQKLPGHRSVVGVCRLLGEGRVELGDGLLHPDRAEQEPQVRRVVGGEPAGEDFRCLGGSAAFQQPSRIVAGRIRYRLRVGSVQRVLPVAARGLIVAAGFREARQPVMGRPQVALVTEFHHGLPGTGGRVAVPFFFAQQRQVVGGAWGELRVGGGNRCLVCLPSARSVPEVVAHHCEPERGLGPVAGPGVGDDPLIQFSGPVRVPRLS